jgi:tetratricopeptide (TPR) repeat protein
MVTREFDPRRAVEIISPGYGTGYRIGGRLVLTAKHLVVGAADRACVVRTASGPVAAAVVWTAPQADAALVKVADSVEPVLPAALGYLPEPKPAGPAKMSFDMFGWPEWARTLLGNEGAKVGGRQIDGEIYLYDQSGEGLLVLEPKRHGGASVPGQSPWVGMSGAAVVCGGLVVAVQHHHQRPERPQSLEAVPVKMFWDSGFQAILAAHSIPVVLEEARTARTEPGPGRWTPTPRFSASRLPATGGLLFGRSAELKQLDDAWDGSVGRTRILSIVAWAGVGKTALVRHWRGLLSQDQQYRGAELVFDWSFYNQGTSGNSSAEAFIDAGLKLFGKGESTRPREPRDEGGEQDASIQPWDRGKLLGELLSEWRTLLILDGLEPLQYPPGRKDRRKAGRLRDQGLLGLFRALAEPSPKGLLCVITTREPVDDLADLRGVAETLPLTYLSESDGGRLLRTLGVDGPDDELRQAARAFGGHALALTLLGSYINAAFPNRDVRHWREVDLLIEDKNQGGHARRVMRSYENWLGAKSRELAILRILSLFDRPADPDALAAVRAKPVIPGLTEAVTELTDREWNSTLQNLVDRHLVTFSPLPAGPPTRGPDVHPLVREHFGAVLESKEPQAWRAGHDRLYEHFKGLVPALPDENDEVMILFRAMAHGCAAGRYEDALKRVYEDRVVQVQTNRYLSTVELGAYEPGLAALSNFYDETWKRPVQALSQRDQAILLHETGVHLHGVGRLAEALEPFTLAVELFDGMQAWDWASTSARYVGELYMILGVLNQATIWGERTIGFAARANDGYAQMAGLNTLGETLHHRGQLIEAGKRFNEAEQVRDLEGNNPIFNFRYFFWGLGHCDLLLTLNRADEALRLAERAQQQIEQTQRSLLTAAQIHLALGSTLCVRLHAQKAELAPAQDHLDEALGVFRRAGNHVHLPRGLLARAELHRLRGDLGSSQTDLDNALTVATRDHFGLMKLYMADCYLGYSRLRLVQDRKAEARQNLERASQIIQEVGYHRRDREIKELDKMM